MKELIKDHQDSAIEIREDEEQKKTIKHLGRVRHVRGLTLFEFNRETKELIPAKFHTASVMISGTNDSAERTEVLRVNIKKNCFYLQALNLKNAKRKLGLR